MKPQRIMLITLAIMLVLTVGLQTPSSAVQGNRPDPGFTAVTGPPFDAQDIWVDTELNGFGAYFSSVGDPLWPDHVNRVYARVRNFGSATASNLTITFSVRQPAGIGDGGYWEQIGMLNNVGPIRPLSFLDASIEWTPRSDAPVSFKVEIAPLANEISMANNSVIEGSSFFVNDGLREVTELDFTVHNPSETSGVTLFFEAVVTPQSSSKAAQQGQDWQVVLNPESRYLRAGSDCTVTARIIPPDPCLVSHGQPAHLSLIGSYERPGQARTRFGGATLLARSVRTGEVTLDCSLSSQSFFTGQLLEASCLQNEQDYFRNLRRVGEMIVLEYRSPNGQRTMRTVRTNADGGFSDQFTPVVRGTWGLQAHWIGDGTHTSAGSAPCTFNIEGGGGCAPPTMTCPPNAILAVGANCRATFNQLATATSDCPVMLSTTPSLPAMLSPGIHTIIYTATTTDGRMATCTTTVTVIDQTPPAIFCPSNIVTTENPPGSGNATVNYTGLMVSDNCSGVAAPTCNPASGSSFPLGITTVTCSATDAADNASTCSFTVTVNNASGSCTLFCPAHITTSTAPGQCGADVNYPPPMSSGTCGTVMCEPASGSFFNLGMTTVTCTAMAGNTCSFTVTVVDQTPPMITCPANVTVDGGDNCVFTFNDMAMVADNCDPEPTITSNPPLPAMFGVGIHTVVFTATDDAGNTASCMMAVTVTDTTPPVMTCPDYTMLVGDADCMAMFNDMATAMDNCDPDVTVTSDPPLPATFNYGMHTITFTATDDAGNTAMCMMIVEVIDANPPTANAGPDQDSITSDLGLTITLNGTGSSDPDGQPLTYLWTQIDGPAVMLDDPTSPMPTYFNPTDHQWRAFQLTVTDTCGVMATDTVMVRIRFP